MTAFVSRNSTGRCFARDRWWKSTEELPFPRSYFGSEITEADIARIIGKKLPELIVPYRDAANLIVRHLERSGKFSGKRVGIALPAGMTGEKLGLGQ